jgi:hypothetical protein
LLPGQCHEIEELFVPVYGIARRGIREFFIVVKCSIETIDGVLGNNGCGVREKWR